MYYIIANNRSCKRYICDILLKSLKEDDIVYVFNTPIIPIDILNTIADKCKLIHVFRDRGVNLFHGETLYGKIPKAKNLFLSVKPYPIITRNHGIFVDINVIMHMWETRQKYYKMNPPKLDKPVYRPQSGSCLFEHLKKTEFKTDTHVTMIGFNSIYPGGVWCGHSKFLEDIYFEEQQKIFPNLVRIIP